MGPTPPSVPAVRWRQSHRSPLPPPPTKSQPQIPSHRRLREKSTQNEKSLLNQNTQSGRTRTTWYFNGRFGRWMRPRRALGVERPLEERGILASSSEELEALGFLGVDREGRRMVPPQASGDGGLARSRRRHDSSGQGAPEKEEGGLGETFLVWTGDWWCSRGRCLITNVVCVFESRVRMIVVLCVFPWITRW